jgi:siroheme synthase-like protein
MQWFGGAGQVSFLFMNALYPVFLDLRGKLCLVAGGGSVATRKAVSLLEAGARVRVVSPDASPEIRELASRSRIEMVPRPFREDDAAGVSLAVAATDDEEANRAVSAACKSRGVLCNVVDTPELCDFHVPAILERGDVRVAVSTGGRCPAFAALVRDRLATMLGDRYAEAARILGEFRERLKNRDDLDRRARTGKVKAAVRSRPLADYLDGIVPDFEPPESP